MLSRRMLLSAVQTDVYIYYYNADGSILLYEEAVSDDGNGTDPVSSGLISVPEKLDPAYMYEFSGWSLTPNGEASDTALLNVKVSRNVYAAFIETGYRIYNNGITHSGASFSNAWGMKAVNDSYCSYSMSVDRSVTIDGESQKTIQVYVYDSSTAGNRYAVSSWVENQGFTGAFLKQYSKIYITAARKIANNSMDIHRLGLYSDISSYNSNIVASVNLLTTRTGTSNVVVSTAETEYIDIPSTLEDDKIYYLGLVFKSKAASAYPDCYSYTTKLWLEK